MALWSRRDKRPVASVDVAIVDDAHGSVTHWVAEDEPGVVAYHTILLYMMHYSRLLFFLSYRHTADDLVGWMEEAVRALAEAAPDEPVRVSREWTLVPPAREPEPRAVWSARLMLIAPKKYRVSPKRPDNPEDAHAQAAALLHLQWLIDTLAPLERAHLALGIAGMHEYYRTIKHWGNSKTLHAAVMHGMAYATRTLQGKR